MSRVFSLCIQLSLLVHLKCLPLFEESLRIPTSEELTSLKKFGYLPKSRAGTEFAFDSHSLREAVKLMQIYGGLTATGTIDTLTEELFKRRRCGVRDVFTYDDDVTSRRKRYVIESGGGWKKRHLSYKFINKSSTLPSTLVDQLFAAALALWAPHSGLTFSQVEEGSADIVVGFYTWYHGCAVLFDGPGYVLAHAFPPAAGGALHFDDDEDWYEDDEDSELNVTAIKFFNTAFHEIGHALGLKHTSVRGAAMFAYYSLAASALADDDVQGIKALYPDIDTNQETNIPEALTTADPNQNSTKANSTRPALDSPPNLCDCNFDTIQVIWGKIYVFKDQWLWLLSDRRVLEEGYPKRLDHVFPGLSDIRTVNAAYETLNGHVAIFSGRNIYTYNTNHQLTSITNLSTYNLPSFTLELQAVFRSNVNNKTYLFEKERFWRYDEGSGGIGGMDEGYPRQIGEWWRQVPYPIGSVLVWSGETYFFRGCRFWRFENSVVAAAQNYPVPVAPVWFPCQLSLSNREISELDLFGVELVQSLDHRNSDQ